MKQIADKFNSHKKVWENFFRVAMALLIILATIIPSVTAYAEDSEWKSKYEFPNDEIKKETDNMFKVSTDQLTNMYKLAAWLDTGQSYIMLEKDNTYHESGMDGLVSYAFNTPNLPQLIKNFFQMLNTGGWRGIPYDRATLQNTDESQWTTARKKYGYNLPTPAYIGEMPSILFDFQELTGSFVNFENIGKTAIIGLTNEVIQNNPFSRLFKAITGMEIPQIAIELTSYKAKDIHTLEIKNIDYVDPAISNIEKLVPWIERWGPELWGKNNVEKWFLSHDIKVGDHWLLEPNFIVKDGEHISGKDEPGAISGREVLNRIIKEAGGSAPFVISSLIQIAHNEIMIPLDQQAEVGSESVPPPHDRIYRTTPYDLSNMSPESQKLMNGISDPRVEMFKRYAGPLGIIGTFVTTTLHSFNCMILLNGSKVCCELAGNLNSISSLKFLTENNVDIFTVWTGTVGAFVVIALAALAIIVLIKGVIKIGAGKEAGGRVVSKTILIVLLIFLVIGLLANPKAITTAIVNTTDTITNPFTKLLKAHPQFQELYVEGEASEGDITELRYWAAYFNIWSGYAVNHTFNEKANTFTGNIADGNEYIKTSWDDYSQSPAHLKNNKKINLWSVVLLEELSDNDTNNATRTIDHFMAPKVKMNDYPNFSVERNNNWNNMYPYSVPPFGGLCIALAIFLLTVIKFLCFCELAIDLALIFIRVITGAFQGSMAVKHEVKSLGYDLLRILAYEVMVVICIWMTFATCGINMTFVGILVLSAVLGLIIWLLKSPNGQQSPLAPGTFKLIASLLRRIGAVVKQTAHTAKNVATQNYGALAEQATNGNAVGKKKESMKGGSTGKAKSSKDSGDLNDGGDPKVQAGRGKSVSELQGELNGDVGKATDESAQTVVNAINNKNGNNGSTVSKVASGNNNTNDLNNNTGSGDNRLTNANDKVNKDVAPVKKTDNTPKFNIKTGGGK